MVTPAAQPPPPDYDQLTFDQVFEQVSAADAQTFYRKAQEFERAAKLLETVAEQVRRHRRELEEVWTNRDPERFGVLDRLVRHLGELLGRLGEPDYAQLLRRLGDTVVDSQQRLRALRDNNPATPADAAAGADRDQRARQILSDLSTSYTQFGGSLTELPHHGATGQALPPPPASHRAPVAPAALAETPQSFAGTGEDRAQEFRAGVAGLDGAATPPTGTPLFARFAHYAGRPELPEEALRPKEFAGFAEMALARDAKAVFPVAGAHDRAEAKGDKDKEEAKEAGPEPVVPGAVTSVVGEPGVVAPGTAPVPTTGGHPGASSAVAHGAARISGISLPDKLIGVPQEHLSTPSPPAPAGGPVAPAVATAAAPGASPDGTAGPMPPGAAGGPVAPGVLTGSAQSRAEGVWRRADPDAWQQGEAGVEHLGRQDSGDGKDVR